VRRALPLALYAASVVAFVVSGLHSGGGGLERPPARASKPVSRIVYYVDATVGGKPSDRKCITEGSTSRVTTTPCP